MRTYTHTHTRTHAHTHDTHPLTHPTAFSTSPRWRPSPRSLLTSSRSAAPTPWMPRPSRWARSLGDTRSRWGPGWRGNRRLRARGGTYFRVRCRTACVRVIGSGLACVCVCVCVCLCVCTNAHAHAKMCLLERSGEVLHAPGARACVGCTLQEEGSGCVLRGAQLGLSHLSVHNPPPIKRQGSCCVCFGCPLFACLTACVPLLAPPPRAAGLVHRAGGGRAARAAAPGAGRHRRGHGAQHQEGL